MDTDKSYGPVIGLIIIILIIALGSVYFLGQRSDKMNDKIDSTQMEQITTQSNSDEIADIEADLNSTEFSDLDAELNDIDAEFEASTE